MTNSIYKYPLEDVRPIKDLRDMLQQSAKLYGNHAAYLVKDPIALREIQPRSEEAKAYRPNPSRSYGEISFDQFYQDVLALGSALKNLGVSAEDRVAIFAETRYEWYVSYMATVCGLAVVVPLDKEQPANDLLSLLQRSETDVILYSNHKASVIEEIRPSESCVKHWIQMDLPSAEEEEKGTLYFWDLIEQGNQVRQSGDTSYDQLPIDPEIMSILLFTSGTTSRSKAVMLSHHNICSNLMGMCQMVYIGPGDVFLSLLPLHHTYECTCGYLCQIYRGSTVAVSDGLRYIAQNMKESKVTAVLMVPLIMEAIEKQIQKKLSKAPSLKLKFKAGMTLSNALMAVHIDLRRRIFHSLHEMFGGHVRLLICGGAKINPQILSNFKAVGINAIQGYGLTECAPILALNRAFYSDDHSAGLPLPGCEIQIINQDEYGIGEVIGRGPNVMLGYYQDPEKTAEAIDDEGFYHTGDYGYLTPEKFLILTGRKANLIVTKNGKNIFPEELEALLSEYDLVKEVVVYGQPQPDGDLLVSAEIYPSSEAISEDPDLKGCELTDEAVKEKLQEIVKDVNHKLVSYKHIKAVTLRDTEFEKTTSRKIKRGTIAHH